jgi:hypothetical protein
MIIIFFLTSKSAIWLLKLLIWSNGPPAWESWLTLVLPVLAPHPAILTKQIIVLDNITRFILSVFSEF